MTDYELEKVIDFEDSQIKRYSRLIPLLQVVCIRINENGLDGLFVYDDGYFKNWSLKHYIGFYQGAITYAIKRVQSICHKKNSYDKVLLSDNFLLSPRYKGAQEILLESGRVVGTMASADCNIYTMHSLKSANELTKNIYKNKLIPAGLTTADKKLKLAIVELYLFLEKLFSEGKKNTDYREEAERVLSKTLSAYDKNIKRLKKVFEYYHLSAFVTMNEYNLKDLLCIMAARETGRMKTKYYSHFCKYLFYDKNEREDFLIYSDEAFFWNKVDLEYVKNNVDIRSDLKDIKLDRAGSPELIREEIEKRQRENEKQDKILVMIPASRPYLGFNREVTKENLDFVTNKKTELFEAIDTCAKENNMKVVVRHNPTDFPEYNKADLPIIERLGFEVADGDSSVMHNAFCEAKAVFSVPSSTLYFSQVYGCETFALRWDGIQLSFTLCEEAKDIHDVDVKDIAKLMLSKKISGISTDGCFDMQALLG